MIVSSEESDVIVLDAGSTCVKDTLDRAIALHNDKNLDQAEILYRQILSIDPEHARALSYLGLLHAQRGLVDDAMLLLQRALASNPRLAEVRHHLGLVMQHLGRHAEALDHF